MDDVIILTSPKAGSGAHRGQVPRLEDLLRESGRSHLVTTSIEEFKRQLAQRREKGENPVVVAAGGDGTISLVAKHIDRETRLIPLPLGTENLLARYFGYHADAAQVMDTLNHGKEFLMDAGLANGKLFLVMVSCGFDADVVRRLHLRRRGHIRRLSYALPILRSVFRYSFPQLRVSVCDTETPDSSQASTGDLSNLSVGWCMAFNLPRYAGGMHIEPNAVGDDGFLDLITFGRRSRISGLGYVAGIFARLHHRFASVKKGRIRRFRVESEHRVPYQLDGDYAGKLPLEVEVLPARVRFLLPSS